MPDGHEHTSEETFMRLLEEHSRKADADKQRMLNSLEALEESMQALATSTKDMLEAYNTAQQAIKISIFLGKAIKWIGSMLLFYYSISELLHSLHKT